jgi:hypothetical protein
MVWRCLVLVSCLGLSASASNSSRYFFSKIGFPLLSQSPCISDAGSRWLPVSAVSPLQGVTYCTTNIFKRNLCKLQMRKVAYSLYRPCRESPTNTVSKENSACCRCGKSQTPCIAVSGSCRPRVLPFRGVFDPAYGQYGKSRRCRWSEVDSLIFKRAPR